MIIHTEIRTGAKSGKKRGKNRRSGGGRRIERNQYTAKQTGAGVIHKNGMGKLDKRRM